jgi:enterochelin esterase-like enzyme
VPGWPRGYRPGVRPPGTGPQVDGDGATFAFPDPGAELAGVWLVQEVVVPRGGPEFDRVEGGWRLRFPRPPVDRMEYLLELVHPDGRSELVVDPTNPLRAPGAFGEKSVVQFPEYVPPQWLDVDAPPGRLREVGLPLLGAMMQAGVWSPADTDDETPVPLLVVHDGIEFGSYAGLTRMLDALTCSGALPPMRAALLHPIDRDGHYSASPDYAAALAGEVLPRLHELAPTPPGRRYRVGHGASLGALAMLHAHRTRPELFGGLFLQSGSFFHHRYDRFELGFEQFQRIRWFMDRVHAEREWALPVPVAMTCGRPEFNLPNNRATSLVLRSQGYPVTLRVVPDAHNWIGWRDACTPDLVDLLTTLWR